MVATRAYDAAGQLTEEAQVIDGLPFPVVYAYDAAGRQIRMTYPDGTVVDRPVTTRGQLASVSMAGQPLSRRTYDVAGRLVRQDLGNGVTEVRSDVPGDRLVARIAATAAAGTVITDFRYAYDANKRKLSEVDGVQVSAGQSFGYDPQDRLTAWSQGQSGATVSATQTWALTAVGDWAATTRNGVTETRTHTDVHEIASIDGAALTWDATGNLLTAPGLQTLGWDVENRLISANGLGPNGPVQARYAYDALGRRVQKTVNGVTTTWLSAGPQVVLEVTGRLLNAPWLNPLAPLITPPTPDLPTGAILAQSGPGVVRVNVQPGASATPDGWLADTGAAYGLHGDRTYGWSASLDASALVDRAVLDEPTWDTTGRMAAEDQAGSTWSIALPNGTYPVIVIMGDAASREHTNTVAVNGAVQVDPTPWVPGAQIGYEQGSFDGYAVDVTVTNGRLTIAPVLGQSWNPSLCCVEIGAQGTSIDAATRQRLADTVKRLTEATAHNRGTTPTVVRTAYGSYVDESIAFRRAVRGQRERTYWVHVNHLYSVAALTDKDGIVVERYAYDAYGSMTILGFSVVVRSRSAVGWDRGFTGYIVDSETGLCYAKKRYMSPALGRFVSRDPIGDLGNHKELDAFSGITLQALSSEGMVFSSKLFNRTQTIPVWSGSAGSVGVNPAPLTMFQQRNVASVETLEMEGLAWMGLKTKDGGTTYPYAGNDPANKTDPSGEFIWNPVSFSAASGCVVSVCGGSGCAGSGCAGSGCVGSACGTSGCGASACGGSGCAGSACGGSGCVGSGCVGSACAGSGCGGSACAGSACVGSACLVSGCVGSMCGGSGCVNSGCGGSVCVASGCLGSVCGGSACVGSACGGSACGGSVCGGSGCSGSSCSSSSCTVSGCSDSSCAHSGCSSSECTKSCPPPVSAIETREIGDGVEVIVACSVDTEIEIVNDGVPVTKMHVSSGFVRRIVVPNSNKATIQIRGPQESSMHVCAVARGIVTAERGEL